MGHIALTEKILADSGTARFIDWGLRDYGEVLAMQEQFREQRRAGQIPDTWLAGEHPTVITQGVRGREADLTLNPCVTIPVHRIDRGGMTTLHNPGQLVIYPIVKTHEGLLAQARLARALLEATADLVEQLSGVRAAIERGRPGLYVKGRKLAAIGISIRGRVSMHGIAINLCNDLAPWQWIVPCGEPSTRPVTLSELAGKRIEPKAWIERLPAWLQLHWGYRHIELGHES